MTMRRFQHTAARRRLGGHNYEAANHTEFQHTAARRRLEIVPEGSVVIVDVSTHSRPKAAGGQQCAPNANSWFQHTAARRRLVVRNGVCYYEASFQHTAARRRLVDVRHAPKRGKHRFNTQPPEGGWILRHQYDKYPPCFNTQPPEGGWASRSGFALQRQPVSTHSRPKAAGD